MHKYIPITLIKHEPQQNKTKQTVVMKDERDVREYIGYTRRRKHNTICVGRTPLYTNKHK